MKNTYLTGYLPLLSIVLFSFSFSAYMEGLLIRVFKNIGLYSGMLEFLSETELKITVFAGLAILFFMVLSTLKLIAGTINEISMLFFSKDREGGILKDVRPGSIIYFAGSIVSVFCSFSIIAVAGILLISTVAYLVYFVYKVGPTLSFPGLVGMIFFQVFTWSLLTMGTAYVFVKLYNTILAGLPI